MKTLAVIQARMASNRLHGKVMKIIGNKRAIGWAVNAAMRAIGVDAVMVATSTNKENDVIEEWCHQNGVACYRGSEDNVLSRYCDIIRTHQPDIVLRLTADCPFLDSKVIGECLALHRATKASYTTNQWPPTWPDGLDTEVINAWPLLCAGEMATSQTDLDTVTQYIWRNQSRWPASNLSCPLPGLHSERWVLDSPEDLQLLKLIASEFQEEWEPNYLDIWHCLNEHPEWRDINRNWTRNQRFFEAIGGDKITHDYTASHAHLHRALEVVPNGSQTYSKSCLAFPEGGPLFASHGNGSYLFDLDGNRYIDLVGALLPNILGYNDPDVDYAIKHQLDKGISLSLGTELEATLAETLVELIPCAEMARFGKNGSDATSAAVRLARYHTGRDRVGIIAAGEGYHGWHDWAVAWTPRDAGVPGLTKVDTHRIEPNIEKVTESLCRHRYAAIIIDPENHGVSFLKLLRQRCTYTNTLLIFDEIRTGFRYALGGYQEFSGVIPDLACFGKSMANGMPISALVGPKEYMSCLNDKDGPFWSGTFFGETLSLAAAIATINKIRQEGVIDYLWSIGQDIASQVPRLTGHVVRPLIEVEPHMKTVFISKMAEEGVLILNSNNLNFAMGQNEISKVIKAYDKVLA